MKNEISVALKPVETKKASEEIYEQIRRLIINGEIEPGQRLPSERKMMEQMQRSRATIREALRLLERDGYIRTQPGSSGAIIQKPNVNNAVQSLESIMMIQQLKLENILEFRRMTENTGARLACRRRTVEELRRMREILKEARASFGDKDRFIELDLEFHNAVAEAAQNTMYVIMLQVCRKMIGEALGDLLYQGSEARREARYLNIQNAHEAIYHAIEQHMEDAAEEALNAHLQDAENDLREWGRIS